MNRKEFFTRTAALTLGLLSAPQLLAKQNKSTDNLITQQEDPTYKVKLAIKYGF